MATAPKKPFTSDPDVVLDSEDIKKPPTNDSGAAPQENTSTDSTAKTIKIGS